MLSFTSQHQFAKRRTHPHAGKALPLLALLMLAIAVPVANAQTGESGPAEFSISPSPIGSGARAAGMFDAFVAIADDATAASWNPAGLVQLEDPELSIVGSWNRVRDTFSTLDEPGAEGSHAIEEADFNFASYSHPIYLDPIERSLTLSLSYQQKYIFDRQFDIQLLELIPDFDARIDRNYRFDQHGSLSTIAFAAAIEITHELSIGLAMNLWRDSPFAENGWKQTVHFDTRSVIADDPPEFTNRVTTDTYENLKGENYSIGLLWAVSRKWNIGLRYDTSFKADVDFESTTFGSNVMADPTIEGRKIQFPSTYAMGVSYRSSDRLTLSLDVSTTDWSGFTIEDAAGIKASLIDGSRAPELTDFDRTYTYRLGIEYVFIPREVDAKLNQLWTIRGGFLLDEEPASNASTLDSADRGDGDPDTFYGIALGLGYQWLNRFNFDLAYQYRFADDVNSDRIGGLTGFKEDYEQHRILLSTVIYFGSN